MFCSATAVKLAGRLAKKLSACSFPVDMYSCKRCRRCMLLMDVKARGLSMPISPMLRSIRLVRPCRTSDMAAVRSSSAAGAKLMVSCVTVLLKKYKLVKRMTVEK